MQALLKSSLVNHCKNMVFAYILMLLVEKKSPEEQVRVQILNKHLGMAKLKSSLFGVLFWVWFWFCLYSATQPDFKEWEPIFHQSYHAGFKAGCPSRDSSVIFHSLQPLPLNGSRAASASQARTWDSAIFPFVFHFREYNNTKKGETDTMFQINSFKFKTTEFIWVRKQKV